MVVILDFILFVFLIYVDHANNILTTKISQSMVASYSSPVYGLSLSLSLSLFWPERLTVQPRKVGS